MSYSALTEIGVAPLCPACGEEITDSQDIVVALVTKAVVNEGFNEDSELEPRTVTAAMDWTDQIAFHLSCLQKSASHFLELGS